MKLFLKKFNLNFQKKIIFILYELKTKNTNEFWPNSFKSNKLQNINPNKPKKLCNSFFYTKI